MASWGVQGRVWLRLTGCGRLAPGGSPGHGEPAVVLQSCSRAVSERLAEMAKGENSNNPGGVTQSQRAEGNVFK